MNKIIGDKMAKIEEKVENLLCKTIENLGYELYDVIYEKQAQDYYLRIFIDSQKGISLEDCEKVNDAISDLLDEADYIKEQYFLEVSSPGIERVLRKEKHLQENIEKEIVINLFKPIILNEENIENKKKNQVSQKQIEGILKEFDNEKIILEIQTKEIIIERKNIANIKLKFNW